MVAKKSQEEDSLRLLPLIGRILPDQLKVKEIAVLAILSLPLMLWLQPLVNRKMSLGTTSQSST